MNQLQTTWQGQDSASSSLQCFSQPPAGEQNPQLHRKSSPFLGMSASEENSRISEEYLGHKQQYNKASVKNSFGEDFFLSVERNKTSNYLAILTVRGRGSCRAAKPPPMYQTLSTWQFVGQLLSIMVYFDKLCLRSTSSALQPASGPWRLKQFA